MKTLRKQKNLKFIDMINKLWIVFITSVSLTHAQVTIEEISAVVGNNIILKSDIQQQILQYQAQGLEFDSTIYVQVFEDLLFQKLMLHQAKLDSVEVTEIEVFNEIDSRLNNFIAQLGGEDQLEAYFDKKKYQIKEEMYEPIEESIIIQKVRYGISSSVTITPGEVKEYFKSFDLDTMPEINETVEVSQILKLPPSSDESVKETKIKLDKLKERVLKGESFATLAILYSEDPGSSRNGGLYTGIKRGMFVKEFENVMYSLEEKEISDVFKTEYGYHIVQMEERRGVEVDVRHILMSPKISNSDLNLSKEDLMEVRDSILDGNLTFETACLFHSDDTDTKFNGGKLINSNTGNSFFELHELPNSIKISVESLNVGDISTTNYLKSDDGKESYTIYKLFSRKEAHEANLKDDYKKIRDLALEFKKDQSITEWINTSLVKTYVRVSDQYESMVFQYNWLKE